jgi:hypothetical protein
MVSSLTLPLRQSEARMLGLCCADRMLLQASGPSSEGYWLIGLDGDGSFGSSASSVAPPWLPYACSCRKRLENSWETGVYQPKVLIKIYCRNSEAGHPRLLLQSMTSRRRSCMFQTPWHAFTLYFTKTLRLFSLLTRFFT